MAPGGCRSRICPVRYLRLFINKHSRLRTDLYAVAAADAEILIHQRYFCQWISSAAFFAGRKVNRSVTMISTPIKKHIPRKNVTPIQSRMYDCATM